MSIKLPDANDQQGWDDLLWRKAISPSSSVILSLDNVCASTSTSNLKLGNSIKDLVVHLLEA